MIIERRQLLAASLLMLVGCGGPAPCVVTGMVFVDNGPADGVYVVFNPIGPPEKREVATARTSEDGSFSLTVSQPGESAIIVFWPKVKVAEGESIEGADLLEGQYRDLHHPVSKVAIQQGENILQPI